MKLSAYNGRDIQLFIAMINRFEGGGITDVRFMRERLESALRERLGATRLAVPKEVRIGRQKIAVDIENNCPKCGSAEWYPGSTDGVFYYACRSCRYSRVVK